MRCNYCNLKEYQRRAAAENLQVVVVQADYGNDEAGLSQHFPNGKDVYIIPAGEELATIHWSAWFGELPDHCEC